MGNSPGVKGTGRLGGILAEEWNVLLEDKGLS